MKNLIVFMVASFFVCSTFLIVNNQLSLAQGGIAPNPCDDVENVQAGCNPPTLQQAEFLVGQAIAAIYGLTSVIFIGAFIYNGFIYMLGYFPEAKYWFAGATIENAADRMVQWVIALIIVLISYPLVYTLITFLIPAGSTCYDNLRVPGFTFFFPNVCTNGDNPPATGPTPLPTHAASGVTLIGPIFSSAADFNSKTRGCSPDERTKVNNLNDCSTMGAAGADTYLKYATDQSYGIYVQCTNMITVDCRTD